MNRRASPKRHIYLAPRYMMVTACPCAVNHKNFGLTLDLFLTEPACLPGPLVQSSDHPDLPTFTMLFVEVRDGPSSMAHHQAHLSFELICAVISVV
eukprot:617437-Pyramimonas_sp.AAC.1